MAAPPRARALIDGAAGRIEIASEIPESPRAVAVIAHPHPTDHTRAAPGRHSQANTLVVHGDLDETVPLADSISWATPRDVPVAVVPGGEHFFHRKLHVLREIVSRWLR